MYLVYHLEFETWLGLIMVYYSTIMNLVAAVMELRKIIKLEKFTTEQVEKKAAQELAQETVGLYMDGVINLIKDQEFSIPESATGEQKWLIEDKLKRFKLEFEFQKLQYFQDHILSINNKTIGTKFSSKVCKKDSRGKSLEV
jgi:hypothetical protein